MVLVTVGATARPLACGFRPLRLSAGWLRAAAATSGCDLPRDTGVRISGPHFCYIFVNHSVELSARR